ncbi:restriction endonuclease [Streptomyces collinus]|uniref:restriction endonuclease n=1 Tax=Streptomyces collinus TaxID=42684 RepID=UPI00378E60AA
MELIVLSREPVASLGRREGCTDVRQVAGANDNGANVIGRRPDGRMTVVQALCPDQHHRELRTARSDEAKVHLGPDLALFATTTRFGRPSEKFELRHGILAVHQRSPWPVEQEPPCFPDRGEGPRAGRLLPPIAPEASMTWSC